MEIKKAGKIQVKQKPHLLVYDVSQIAIEKGIKTRMELLAMANSQKKEGKTDLAECAANHK